MNTEMDFSKLFMIGSVLIAVGTYAATVTAVASDTEQIENRLREVEVKQAKDEAQAVKIAATSDRLERLEILVEKMADQQLQMIKNQSKICTALDADCD